MHTHKEIRAAIVWRGEFDGCQSIYEAEEGEPPIWGDLRGVIMEWGQPLGCSVYGYQPGPWEGSEDDQETAALHSRHLWWNLPPEQARELESLFDGAVKQAITRCETVILEELTAAGVAFAGKHPDARRPDAERLALKLIAWDIAALNRKAQRELPE